MVKLTDLLDEDELAAMIAGGYVSARMHPTEPLIIYNYTAAASYDRVWNRSTLTCRGLIVNVHNGTVAARPLPKFFTWGQPECPTLPLDAVVHVADKQDGSLGILYRTVDGWAVATRGSFASEQALHATELLRTKHDRFEPVPGFTYLFEIVYPGNRIVVDYGDTDDLVFLGTVTNRNGHFHPARPGVFAEWNWTGPATDSLGMMSFEQALAMEPRPGAEGLVLYRLDSGEMIKVKQEEYVKLHALITQTSTTTVWERLAAGESVIDFIDGIPDEFSAWVRATAADLTDAKDKWLNEAHAEFDRMPKGVDRKTFAAAAVTSPYRAALFRILDGRPIEDMAWKIVKPEYARPFEQSEAVA